MLIKLTHAHILGTVIAYLIGVCLVPMVISFSKKEGLVDMPNARKIHTHPISRIGGVAIWTSTMLTFLCLVFMSYYPSIKFNAFEIPTIHNIVIGYENKPISPINGTLLI